MVCKFGVGVYDLDYDTVRRLMYVMDVEGSIEKERQRKEDARRKKQSAKK